MPRATWDNLDERRRERVLHAAMAEFGRRGYSGGSLNVIAREAGVAKGSLFQYFEDKFDFFAYIAEQTSLNVYAAMMPFLSGPAVDESFLQFFGRLVDAWMDYMAVHPLERAVTAATNLELDPQVRQAIREPVHRLYTQALRPVLDQAVASGDIAGDADLDALLAMLILLLPHLALAPFEPGLDAALPLYETSATTRSQHARRLVVTVFASALTRDRGPDW
ncbi:MAG: TetR/AcrR family transcriptional regulator [Actinomycetota bacterium]|nr:TetR/AcrR family transcriptional regulator [Actinomycetota bacterium]